MIDDATLLVRYARLQSQADFAEIVRRYLPAVYSAALRRLGGDTHLAEDVTQATFVALARKAERVASHPYVGAWLHRAVCLESARVVRTEQRRKRREAALASSAMNEPQSESAAWEQLAPQLDAAIARLGGMDRELVLRRFMDGASYAQLGVVFGLSSDAARMRVDRALEKVRGHLRSKGLVSSAAALETLATRNAVSAVPSGLDTQVLRTVHAASSAAAATAATTLSLAGLLFNSAALSVAAAVAAIGVAGYEWRQCRAAETTWMQADAARSAAEHIKAAKPVSAPPAEPAGRIAATPSGARLPSLLKPGWDPDKEGKAFLARHPEVAAAFEQYAAGRTYADYWPIFKRLEWSPDQIRRFLTAAPNEWFLFSRTLNRGYISFGTLPTPQDYQAAKDARLQLVGPNNAAFLAEYEQASRARQLTAAFAGSLAGTDEQISAATAAQLTRLFLAAGTDWDVASAQLGKVLTPYQIDMLQRVHQWTDSWMP